MSLAYSGMVMVKCVYNFVLSNPFLPLIHNQSINNFKHYQLSTPHTTNELLNFLTQSNTMSSFTSTTVLTQSKPSRKYQHSGRGGAGNYLKAPAPVSSSSSSVYSTASTSSRSSHFSTGVGGFGNHHATSGAGFFRAFCNEVSRKRPTVQTPSVYHVGIGGAGNVKN